jgi:hypothetical protein
MRARRAGHSMWGGARSPQAKGQRQWVSTPPPPWRGYLIHLHGPVLLRAAPDAPGRPDGPFGPLAPFWAAEGRSCGIFLGRGRWGAASDAHCCCCCCCCCCCSARRLGPRGVDDADDGGLHSLSCPTCWLISTPYTPINRTGCLPEPFIPPRDRWLRERCVRGLVATQAEGPERAGRAAAEEKRSGRTHPHTYTHLPPSPLTQPNPTQPTSQ